MKTEQEIVDEVASVMKGVLDGFIEATDYPIDIVLVGCHSQIVATMAALVGGHIAAAFCETAAYHVRSLPSDARANLAFTHAAGSA